MWDYDKAIVGAIGLLMIGVVAWVNHDSSSLWAILLLPALRYIWRD